MQFSTFRTGLAALAAALAAGAALAAPAAPAPAATTRSSFPDLTTGEAVYKNICQGCHMPDGKGAQGAGAYPALAGNPKLGAAAYPVMVIINGQKAMPEFGSQLSDAQISGVAEYIRTHFGNNFKDKVPVTDVAPMRPAPQATAAFRAG